MNTTQLCGTMIMTAHKEVADNLHVVANSSYAAYWRTPKEDKGSITISLCPVVEINGQEYVVAAEVTTLKIYHHDRCNDIVEQVSNLLAVAKKYNNGSFFRNGEHHNIHTSYSDAYELLTVAFERDQTFDQYDNNDHGDYVSCSIDVSSLIHNDSKDAYYLDGKCEVFGHSPVSCSYRLYKVNFGTWDTKLIRVDEMPGIYYHFY